MFRVVLIRPETPGNIGAVARAMKNFGFEKLVLVDPCELTEEAAKRAKHAKSLLKNAEVKDEMNWSEYDLTVSTSSETGGGYNVLRNAVTPGTLREKLGGVEGEVGLVFGPESKGLRNEEIKKSDLLCHIPASDEYPVFNLSHAVAMILYELSKREGEGKTYELAGGREKEVLLEQLDGIIEKTGVEDYRHEPLRQSLKNTLGRAMLAKREANTLIGFFRRVKEKL